MIKYSWLALAFCFFTEIISAQSIAPGNIKLLQKKEDSLKVLAYHIVNGKDEGARQLACNEFIPQLVEALKINGSFNYPFDSLKEISILYPDDSSFRIFTWQMPRSFGFFRYYGAMQMHTENNSLKLFPFFDNSEFTQNITDTITDTKGWIGCLYYNLVETNYQDKNYYTLFGFNGNSLMSNKKILEALTFQNDKPAFGAPIFNFSQDTIPKPTQNRFILEYKKDGNARLNYDTDLQMIIYDHLVPLHNEPQKKYTYVPDGDYEAFKWEKGSWMHIEKLFDQKSKTPPFPAPLQFQKNILDKDTMSVNSEQH